MSSFLCLRSKSLDYYNFPGVADEGTSSHQEVPHEIPVLQVDSDDLVGEASPIHQRTEELSATENLEETQTFLGRDGEVSLVDLLYFEKFCLWYTCA